MTGNWKYYCNLLSIDFHRFLDIAWHKQMVEAKELDEDKNGDMVVRVKHCRYGLRCYNYLSREESKSHKITVDSRCGQDGWEHKINFQRVWFKDIVLKKISHCISFFHFFLPSTVEIEYSQYLIFDKGLPWKEHHNEHKLNKFFLSLYLL